MSAPVPRECPLLLLLMPAFLLCLFASAIEVDAQRTKGNTAKATTGTLKLKVPSGITGDNYWIYVNGKLRSSPPRGTPGPLPVMVVSVPDGSSKWEAWNSEGFVTSSARLDEYIKLGDKHGLFRDLEFQLPPGSHSVEFLLPGTGSTNFYPFVSSTKAGVSVRPGSTTEVYLNIPASWVNNAPLLVAANAVGMSLCPNIRQFEITRATEVLIKGVTEYRNHPLRQLLLAALSNYRRGDAVVKIDFGSGLREVDGIQMATIIDRLPGSPYTPSDVAYCRRYLPQFSEAFGEFDVTTEWIYRDRRSFRKLAEDLMAARRDSK